MKRFEHVYTTIYPEQAMYSEVGFQILEVALTAEVATPKPVIPELAMAGKKPPSAAEKGARQVYYRGKNKEFRIYEMDELRAGNVVNGPGIIEHPATTLYIPPGQHVAFDNRRIIHYRAGVK
jgi:N-methylhydantoinase A